MGKALIVEIFGDAKQFGAELDKASGKTRQMGKVAGLAGAAIAGGLVVGLEKSVKAAQASQISQSNMESALKSSGISYQDHAKQIDTVIQSTSKLAALDDEDLQDAFTTITRATGNVNTALKDTKLAADLARGGHMGLEQATKLIASAETGRFKGLQKLVGVIPKVTVEQDKAKAADEAYRATHAKLTQEYKDHAKEQMNIAKGLDNQAMKTDALEAATKKFSGSADAYGKTAAGAQDRLKVSMENVQEALGKGLLPIVTVVANEFSKFTDFLSDHTTVAKILIGVVGAFAAILLTVNVATKVLTASQTLLNVVMEANPIGLVVLALAALAIGLTVAWKHSETFRDIVKGTFAAVMAAGQLIVDFFTKDIPAAFQAVLTWLSNNWKTIAVIISGPFAPLVALATNAFGIRSALEGAFTSMAKWVDDKVSAIAGFVTGLPARVADFGKALFNTFTGYFAGAGIGGWVSDRVADWANFVEGIPGRIGDFGKKLFNTVTGFIEDAQIGTWISKKVGDFADFFGAMPGRVADAVKGKADDLWDGVKHIFDKLPGFVKDALGIKSPSTEFVAIGEAIIHGAIKGIEDKGDDLLSSVTGVFGSVKNKIGDIAGAIGGALAGSTNVVIPKGLGVTQQIAAAIGLASTLGFGTPSNNQLTGGQHAPGSYHYLGEAADFGVAGHTLAQMKNLFMAFYQHYGSAIRELFFDPMGWYVKNGQIISGAIGGHMDHVHLALAKGGIVTRPTMALIGEAGPEAVIPLSRAGGVGGTTVNVYVDTLAGSSVPELARVIRRELVKQTSNGTKLGF